MFTALALQDDVRFERYKALFLYIEAHVEHLHTANTCTAYHWQHVEDWRVLPLFPGQAGAQLEPLQHAAEAAELQEHL